jgi:acyl carrier protein
LTQSVRDTIERQMKAVAKEQGRRLTALRDELALLDTGLDSLCFAILVVRLEDEFGVDPLGESEAEEPPKTFGEFVQLYVDALA